MTYDPNDPNLPDAPDDGWAKLDPDFKAKWVAALRSGKYRQVAGTLRATNPSGKHSFCCLGVACNLISNRRWAEDKYKKGKSMAGWGGLGSGADSGFPFFTEEIDPLNVDAWGRPGRDRGVHATINCLISMNDDFGATFEDIADFVEANL